MDKEEAQKLQEENRRRAIASITGTKEPILSEEEALIALEEIERRKYNKPYYALFAGYSRIEMHYLVNHLFSENSPVRLQENPTDIDYNKVPLLNMVQHLFTLIEETGELQLTAQGYLPRKVVQELASQQYISTFYRAPEDLYRIRSEKDFWPVHLASVLLELGKLTKVRKGKLSLTQKGKQLKTDNNKLMQNLFVTHAVKFNWAYFDQRADGDFARYGLGLSLIFVSKYGDKQQESDFYTKKYLRAFPEMREAMIIPTFAEEYELMRLYTSAYTHRFFNRFLAYFGLVTVEQSDDYRDFRTYVQKTPLFHQFLQVKPHTELPLVYSNPFSQNPLFEELGIT